MTRSKNSQTTRPIWMRWLSAVLLLAFLASSALAGFSFVWCLSLGRAKLACCCHAAAADSSLSQTALPQTAPSQTASSQDSQAPRIERAPCCELRSFDAVGTMEVPRGALPDIAAPAVCVLPPPAATAPGLARAAPLFAALAPPPLPEGRAPPPTPLYIRHARLLC